jgi:hypothetical protein
VSSAAYSREREQLAKLIGGIQAVAQHARERDHLIACGQIADALEAMLAGVYDGFPEFKKEAETSG